MKIFPLLLGALLLCASPALSAPAHVQAVKPQAWAEAQGQKIELAPGSGIERHYVLQTDGSGSLEVRFADGSALTMAANTTIEVSEFVFAEGAESSFVTNISGGAMRMITGAVVEQNPDGFKINTPLGTVGVRGTTLDVLVSNDKVSVIVQEMASGHTVMISGLDNNSVSITEPGMQVDLIRGEPTPPEAAPVNVDLPNALSGQDEDGESGEFAELPHRDVGEQSMSAMEQQISAPAIMMPENIIPIVYPTFILGLPNISGLAHETGLMSRDGRHVLIAYRDMSDFRYYTWDAQSGALRHIADATIYTSTFMAFSGDGTKMYYADSPSMSQTYYVDLTSGVTEYITEYSGSIYMEMHALNGAGRTGVGYYVTSDSYVGRWDFDGTTLAATPVQISGADIMGRAFAVSDSGNIIAGYQEISPGAYRPAYWTRIGASNNYTSTVLGSDQGQINAITPDGAWAAGYYIVSGITDQAFRANTASGLISDIIPPPAGGYTQTSADVISANGKIVAGSATSPTAAFFWSADDPAVSHVLNQHLASNGVNMSGINLQYVRSISADGSIMLCLDTAPQLYVVRIDGDTPGLTTPANIYTSLAGVQAGASSLAIASLPIAQLPGSAYFSMGNIPSAGDDENKSGVFRMWGSGSFSSEYNFNGSDKGAIGAAGVTYFMNNGFSLGGGAFYGWREVEGAWGSSQASESMSFGLYSGYAPQRAGIRLSLGAMLQSYEIDSNRNYPNGAGLATSRGKGSGWGLGITGHAGWVVELSDTLSIQPFAEYTWQHTATPGYDESGGPFPASYDREYFSQNITRLGADLQWDARPDLTLQCWLAWNHRFESEGPASSGQVIGWQSFYLPGSELKQDWGDTGIGLRWRFLDNSTIGFRLGFGIDNDNSGLPDIMSTMSLAVDI